jgi:hypothetical protein
MAVSIKISELPQLTEPTNGSLAVMVDNGITHHILASDLFNNNLSSSFASVTAGKLTVSGSVNITGSITLNGVTYTTLTGSSGIANLPDGVISSSQQISDFGFISSSQTIDTGSFAITGSNLFRGDQTITGSLFVSGTTEFGGDLVPKVARGATIGTLERPFRDIFLQSASINIASDIPGGRGASISNADGNVTIQAAGFQLKTGSFVPFEISETARIIVRVPNIPAGDVGAFSIIGNASGSYQPVTNDGGLIHLTSNDGVSSRITSDAFGTTAFAAYVGRKARGTVANPLPVQSNDTLTRISAIGWTGPEYGFTMSSSLSTAPTSIDVIALENFTTSSFGTAYRLFNTPIGNTTRVLSAQIDTSGLFVSGTFTSSLEEGYTWVGGNGNRTTLVSTSSFETTGRSIISSSAQITALGFISSSQTLDTASFATTGSNTFNGNQTITGSLTLSSGSALNINDGFYVNGNKQFNYGQFSDLTIQSGSDNTAYPMKLNTTDVSMGVSVVSGSFIKVANTGIYNLQFSAQLEQTSNNAAEVSIWLRKDGTNIPNSNTEVTIEKISGGGKMVAAWNYMVQLNANQYVQLMWCSTRSDTQLHYHDVQSTPTRPATPSVIATLTQIG